MKDFTIFNIKKTDSASSFYRRLFGSSWRILAIKYRTLLIIRRQLGLNYCLHLRRSYRQTTLLKISSNIYNKYCYYNYLTNCLLFSCRGSEGRWHGKYPWAMFEDYIVKQMANLVGMSNYSPQPNRPNQS